MTVLAKIRNRAGLLVTIIGVALLVFILQSALESGNFFFGNSDRNVGEIAGKSIAYEEFNSKVQEAIEARKKSSGQSTIDEATTDQIVQQIWNQTLGEMILNKEYEKLGIAISEDELYDLMLGKNPHAYIKQYFTDQKTGGILTMFANPQTGELYMSKVLEYTKQMNEEQEGSWVMLENAIKQARIVEKYNNLVKKGLYITTSQAKDDYFAQNKSFNISYVVKKYASLPDTAVTVDENDIKNYYNEHSNEFKQETSRKIEYIAFDVLPSGEDTAEIKTDINRVANEFKTKTAAEDSAFVIAESDSRNFDTRFSKKGTLSLQIDTIMFNSPIGTVVGPYLENNSFKIAKLISIKAMPDSVKARHILIKIVDGDTATAMRKVDSLKKMITPKNFADIALKNSEDVGSAIKGGDLGWFTEGAMVPPFNDACFNGKKGDMPVVQSQFGVHLIEILDKGVASTRVQVATIDKAILPSAKTLQSVYGKAAEFSGKNNTADLFDKAVIAENLNKRVADNIAEGSKTIPGIESPKELVRWLYEAKKGDVSSAFELGNKFVIAHLVEIKEKGIAPLEQVKDEIEVKAKQEKKAENFIAQFNTSLTGVSVLDAFSKKVNIPVEKMENLTFSSSTIQNIGQEAEVTGTIVTLKKNSLSKPIKGKSGVFVVSVDAIKEAPVTKDYSATKMQSGSGLQSRVDYEVFNALKENAKVIDLRWKFY